MAQDYERLASFMTKCYHVELEKVEMSVRGWNWGNVNFIGKFHNLRMSVLEKWALFSFTNVAT